jgi:hypothetical protein
MKRMVTWAALAACLAIMAGCNTLSGQPEIRKAQITPSELKPGDSAVITVDLKDRNKVVRRVEGVVVEDPRITFKLNDSGVAPDEKAGDGVWSMAVDVPFQSPPGQYILELTALDADGRPVSVRDRNGVVNPLQATVPIRILKTQ